MNSPIENLPKEISDRALTALGYDSKRFDTTEAN